MKPSIKRFLIAGSLTVCVDLICYRLLMFLGLPITSAKATSFIAGTVFAYVINKNWTFEAEGSRAAFLRFSLLYTTTLGVNVSANAGMLWVLPAGEAGLVIAFLIATGVSATCNFLGMQHLVFVTNKELN